MTTPTERRVRLTIAYKGVPFTLVATRHKGEYHGQVYFNELPPAIQAKINSEPPLASAYSRITFVFPVNAAEIVSVEPYLDGGEA